MPTTKAVTAIHSGTTLSAGGGDTTSSAVTLDDGYGATILIKHTNGGTGPTVPAQTIVQYSQDNSEWYDAGTYYGSTTNSDVRNHIHEVPATVEYVRLVSGSNTGQAVTLDSDISEITAV